MLDIINSLSFVGVVLLALTIVPLTFRRAGYPWSQVAFGSVTALVAGLTIWGLIFKIQVRTETMDLPLGWLAVVIGLVAIHFAKKHFARTE